MSHAPRADHLPGEAGQRNIFRGPGYFGIDAGLSKIWNVGEQKTVRFAWEVFNVTNSGTEQAIRGTQNSSNANFIQAIVAPRVARFGIRVNW